MPCSRPNAARAPMSGRWPATWAANSAAAAMSRALRRTRVGPFGENHMISLERLEALCHRAAAGEGSLADFLLPVETALDDIPALAVSPADAARLQRGQAVLMRGRDAPILRGTVYVTTSRPARWPWPKSNTVKSSPSACSTWPASWAAPVLEESIRRCRLPPNARLKSSRTTRTKSGDTGSPEVQVAILSERITNLTEHFKTHAKDNHSRRGLLKMVSQRRHIARLSEANDERRYKDADRAARHPPLDRFARGITRARSSAVAPDAPPLL